MRIGILTTGHPPTEMVGVPSYAAMIGAALGPGYTCREFDVTAGVFPDAQWSADAYFITGSSTGVHDEDSWIGQLLDWLKQADPETPVVGICFGHQIMAQAYGGAVKTSVKGWGVGLHEYRVRSHAKWMDEADRFVIPVVHRDQVVQPPPASRLVAASDFCPYAVLTYTNRRALSFQGHPEFAIDFTAMIIERCQQKGVIGVAQTAQARQSLQQADDRARVFGWIRRFIEAETQ